VPYQTVEDSAKAGKDFVAIKGELIFENDQTEAHIILRILCDDAYTKDVDLFLELLPPRQILDNVGQRALNQLLAKPENTLTEKERIALLGRPRLGENAKVKVHIVECTEFKNLVDRLVGNADSSLVYGTETWKDQFVQALKVHHASDDEARDYLNDEDAMEAYFERRTRGGSFMDYVVHFFTVFWKLARLKLCDSYSLLV
jgi:solute carrier family 8 (sodium/calcium exchanger)